MKFKDMPYERPDLEEIKASYTSLIERLKAAKSGEEVWEIHQEKYKLEDHLMTQITLVEIRNSINTEDPFYEAEQEFMDENIPVITNLQVEYSKALYYSPFRPFMEEKIGKVPFTQTEYAIKSFDEKNIGLMQEENALATRYSKLMATARIPFREETLTMAGLARYMADEDRATRKEAWAAFGKHMSGVTAEIDEIYDKMVKNRTEQAKRMGYDNYIELAYYKMCRMGYNRDSIENLRSQVKEYFVPLTVRLGEKRKARLGVEKLEHYDNGVYFKEGDPKPVGSGEEILLSGQKMYHELSAETGEYMDFMLDNELFDVFAREGKAQGGYMTYLPDYKAPFIFSNFNGTRGDVDVITHECGHAFQGYVVRDAEVREIQNIGAEVAEIHSMSMEYFADGWMELFFAERARDYQTLHLEDGCNFIPYGCMVDEFQHIIYDKPELTPAERKAEWKKLEKIYRPTLDYGDNTFFAEGGFWQKQLHIFMCPFYYIDYVLASLCAMQFKVAMDEDFDDAWKRYMKLCKLSASDYFTGLLSQVGLDSPFADGFVEKLVKKLEAKM